MKKILMFLTDHIIGGLLYGIAIIVYAIIYIISNHKLKTKLKKIFFVLATLLISTVCLCQIVQREEFGETRVYKDGELIRIIRQDMVVKERKNIYAADGVTLLGHQETDRVAPERENLYNANLNKVAFKELDPFDKDRVNVYNSERKKLGHYQFRGTGTWEFVRE